MPTREGAGVFYACDPKLSGPLQVSVPREKMLSSVVEIYENLTHPAK
jgi:hypothetical protein